MSRYSYRACLFLLMLPVLAGCSGTLPATLVPTPTRTPARATAVSGDSRIPPDPPATPLTHDELLQYPLPLIPPGALSVRVSRGTYDFYADAPSPQHPRYGRRETHYTVTNEPATTFSFYRAALPGQGWRYCSSLDHPITPIDSYAHGDDPCDSADEPRLRVSISIAGGNPYEVTIIEDLPPPRSWPDPPTP